MTKKHNQEVDTNMEQLSKAEAFITKNNKKIVAAVVFVGAALISFFGVRSCNEKKTIEGQEAVTAIEQAYLMSADSLSNAAALADLENYINEYGKHAAGIATFEAGVAAFELKDYNKAIELFSQYEGEDHIFNARALACIADCYVELGDYAKAYENYAAAVAASDNDLSSEYAFKAGLVAEKLGNKSDAVAMYQMIKDKYPATPRAAEVDKYISRVEAK